MGMGFAPTWLGQVSPPPASKNHFNHWRNAKQAETPHVKTAVLQCWS